MGSALQLTSEDTLSEIAFADDVGNLATGETWIDLANKGRRKDLNRAKMSRKSDLYLSS